MKVHGKYAEARQLKDKSGEKKSVFNRPSLNWRSVVTYVRKDV